MDLGLPCLLCHFFDVLAYEHVLIFYQTNVLCHFDGIEIWSKIAADFNTSKGPGEI